MMNRHSCVLLFIASCAGSVTQDPPLDPGTLADASADADSVDADPTDAGTFVVSKACASDAECGGDYRCQLTAPGGYCTKFCAGDTDCPTGSVCSPMPYSRLSGICMKSCATTAECRPGYACGIVYLFPSDPGSPSSDSPVCWEPQDAGP